jgi:hypothetical protein
VFVRLGITEQDKHIIPEISIHKPAVAVGFL